MFQNAEETRKFIADEDVRLVDVRFCDLPGIMQHFTVPVEIFDPDEELAFDGSSIRGFQAIHESDSRDPRNVARKAETYLVSTGIADLAYFGPEAEFYVFDSARFETRTNEASYHVASEAGAWNTGALQDNRGYTVRCKGGYFPVPPVDHFADLRAEMTLELIKCGIVVEKQHHEVGTAGRAEINYRFNTLLHAADDLQLYKYIVKNVAWRGGRTATFMPRPIFGDNGSGRQPALLRRGGLRRPVGVRPPLHRRPAQARPVTAGVHQPDGELPSVWSSAPRTRPATRTWPSRRYSSRAWTAYRDLDRPQAHPRDRTAATAAPSA